jgi:single-stranded-DNA-specific exonuclease
VAGAKSYYCGNEIAREAVLPERWKLRTSQTGESVRQSADSNAKALRQKSQEIARSVSVSGALAQVLVNRGVRSVEEARQFLSPRLEDLTSPFLFADMEKAAARVSRAITDREKVLIYGDYDADGITASVLLCNLLRLVDCECECHIPDRLTEGYGVRAQKIEAAHKAGFSLIVTVDCGITSAAEVSLAKKFGIDVIVTDHHEPEHLKSSGSVCLPDAFAILNPKLADSGYQFRELSGAGVAFKLSCAVIEKLSPSRRVSGEFQNYMLDALALAAVGTVADVVPLVGENRTIVKFGLCALDASTSCGLRALLDMANLSGKVPQAEDVAYRIAPRLNAAGRMGRAELALNLLLAGSTEEAILLARELEKENRRRQKIEAETFAAAREMTLATRAQEEPVLFIWGESWHPGVTGIVASRLAEEFCRPVVLVAVKGDRGKGTARSISNFDVHQLLKSCEEHFLAFGGHSFAAGFEVARENLEEVRRILLDAARKRCLEEMVSTLEVDAELPLKSLSVSMVRELERLRPHGEGNPVPVFVTEGVRIAGRAKRVGRDGQHLCFFVGDASIDEPLRALCYRMGNSADALEKVNSTCSIAYAPYINQFRDEESVELKIQDIHIGGRSLVDRV